MSYIPDPIERLEAWEDRMAHKYGNRDGTLNCAGCGVTITAGQCRQLGAAPYGLPVCERCERESREEE